MNSGPFTNALRFWSFHVLVYVLKLNKLCINIRIYSISDY